MNHTLLKKSFDCTPSQLNAGQRFISGNKPSQLNTGQRFISGNDTCIHSHALQVC